MILISSARFYYKTFLNPIMIKTPTIRSILSRQMWVDVLLNGHDKFFYENMGMQKAVFVELRGRLEELDHLPEQLALLLYFLITGLSNTKLNHRFQRSDDTVSK